MPTVPRRNAGQSLVEMALVMALIGVVCIPALSFARAAFVTAYLNQQTALSGSPSAATATATATATPTTITYAVPTDKDQCKKGGWLDYTDANGQAFANQGACVSYVNSMK